MIKTYLELCLNSMKVTVTPSEQGFWAREWEIFLKPDGGGWWKSHLTMLEVGWGLLLGMRGRDVPRPHYQLASCLPVSLLHAFESASGST